jgi:hypothetical protein
MYFRETVDYPDEEQRWLAEDNATFFEKAFRLIP